MCVRVICMHRICHLFFVRRVEEWNRHHEESLRLLVCGALQVLPSNFQVLLLLPNFPHATTVMHSFVEEASAVCISFFIGFSLLPILTVVFLVSLGILMEPFVL